MILILEGIPSNNYILFKNKLIDSGFIYVSNGKSKYKQGNSYLLTNTIIADIAYGEYEKVSDLNMWMNNLYNSGLYLFFVFLNCSYNNVLDKKMNKKNFSKIQKNFKKVFQRYVYFPKLQIDVDLVTIKSGVNNIKRFVGLK